MSSRGLGYNAEVSSHTSILLSIPQSQSQQDVALTFLGQDIANQNPDLHFVNQEETPLQIEDVRQLSQEMMLRPYQSETSTFVILQIDRASLPAQNALLKSLEEPPEHVQIILVTNHPENVLATIQSRCILKRVGEQETADTRHEAGEEKSDAETLMETLRTSPILSIAFTLSEQYKDRDAAEKLLQQLTFLLHQKNQHSPQTKYVQSLQAALVTQDLLQKNVNVRLALEDFFFQLQKLLA